MDPSPRKSFLKPIINRSIVPKKGMSPMKFLKKKDDNKQALMNHKSIFRMANRFRKNSKKLLQFGDNKKSLVELISEDPNEEDQTSSKMPMQNIKQAMGTPGARGENQLSYNLDVSSSESMSDSEDEKLHRNDIFIPQEQILSLGIDEEIIKAIK